jgi:hypothetical protein
MINSVERGLLCFFLLRATHCRCAIVNGKLGAGFGRLFKAQANLGSEAAIAA